MLCDDRIRAGRCVRSLFWYLYEDLHLFSATSGVRSMDGRRGAQVGTRWRWRCSTGWRWDRSTARVSGVLKMCSAFHLVTSGQLAGRECCKKAQVAHVDFRMTCMTCANRQPERGKVSWTSSLRVPDGRYGQSTNKKRTALSDGWNSGLLATVHLSLGHQP